MNPQSHRRLDGEHDFVIVATAVNEDDRKIELHLTEGEIRRLRLDMTDFLDDKPEVTRITSYN